jgi:ABC-type transport system involved in cytochrome c biogenesis permease subunit
MKIYYLLTGKTFSNFNISELSSITKDKIDAMDLRASVCEGLYPKCIVCSMSFYETIDVDGKNIIVVLLGSVNSTAQFFETKKLAYIIPKDQLFKINSDFNYNLNALSYYNILPYKNLIADNTTKIFNKYKNNYPNKNINNINTERNQAILTIANLFKNTESDKINTNLKLIPPDNFTLSQDTNWLAPWEIINSGNGTPNTARYLNLLQNLVCAYYNNYYSTDQTQISLASNQLKHFALILAANNLSSVNLTITPEKLNKLLTTEYYYNKLKLLNKSLILYFFSLMLAIYVFIKSSNKNNLNNQSIKPKTNYILFSTFSLAFCCHLISLFMRIYILQRPPVANLYESILFVGLITAILSIIIELLRKDNIGILLGSLICFVLQFIANSYANNGDSLNILIAVLNNNFWLGTHVIAITSGYGCCLILSALSHIYLISNVFKKNKMFKQQLFNYILAFGLLSLFLTLLGTILGGIWADQSWGRFWGWDPKENGALLICLWLIALLHGKISGQLKNIMFVACAAMTSITVALAWFGVNLLSTGLHSYGFTENIATNLILFIIFELMLILGLIYFNTKLIKNNI